MGVRSLRNGGRMNKIAAVMSAVLALVSTGTAVAQAGSQCASPDQIAAVRSALEGKEPSPLGATAAALKIPEAIVASALPPAQSYGIDASQFQAVWKSIETWTDAVTFITKGPNLFEVLGPVGQGEPSKRSKFFNVKREGPGLAGHFRPDLFSSIYVLEIPGKVSTLRGVVFFEPSGEAVFTVYVPGEGGPSPEAVVKQFSSTAALIRSFPSVCPR